MCLHIIENVIPLINVLDVSREDPRLHVRASSGEENIIRMPVNRKDSRPDGLLQQPGNPPVSFRIKRTNRDCPADVSDNNLRGTTLDSPSTTGNSKFILVGAPFNIGCSTIDAK